MGINQTKIEAKFPEGQVVRIAADVAYMFPTLKGKTAVVKGVDRQGFVKVLFEGRKTVTKWSPDYLKPIQEPTP